MRPNRPEELDCLALGVGHGDEGLCLLVGMGPYQILLDCGLDDLQKLELGGGQRELDLAWCSHAHPHNARSLATLHHRRPQLPIYSTAATKTLLGLDCCQILAADRVYELRPNLTARVFPAGHLPGGAALWLSYRGLGRAYTLVYISDFFLSSTRCTDGLVLEQLRQWQPDVLILGGSQGTQRHPHRRRQEAQVAHQIDRLLASRNPVVIYAPEQGPELVLLLRSHPLFTRRSIELWLDDTTAQVCDRYQQCLAALPLGLQNLARDRALFWDERVSPRVRPLNRRRGASDSSEIILLGQPHPSYPADLGPQDGPGRLVPKETFFLRACADGAATTQLIHSLRPQHLVLVNGSPDHLADLAALEELHSRYKIHLPAVGSALSLPIGDTFFRAATPMPSSYEGELEEDERSIRLSFPRELTRDPRWQAFADTGLVEAQWRGEELVLRGLSARQLMTQREQIDPIDQG